MTSWEGIQPGDVGFDQGGGLVGFLIRHFSHSPYAHCWIYHDRRDDGSWHTAEAYPGGLRMRVRSNDNVHRVVRVANTIQEQHAILDKSDELVGSGYNYRELFRIVHYRLRKIFAWLAGLLAILVVLDAVDVWEARWLVILLIVLLVYAAIPLRTSLNPRKVICSNHVAQCVLRARPDVTLTYPPQSIWPGRLERDLNVMSWNDQGTTKSGS